MSTDTRRPTTVAAPKWEYALCAQTDPDLFFPEGYGTSITRQAEKAKKVCDRCPIRSGCLEWALETGQMTGIWGGLDSAERRTLFRRRSDHGASYARCIEEQEYIERRVAEGASQRTIAEELGVGHSAVGKAWRLFEDERAALDAASKELAA